MKLETFQGVFSHNLEIGYLGCRHRIKANTLLDTLATLFRLSRHLDTCIRCGTLYAYPYQLKTSGIRYQALGIRHHLSGIRYQVSSSRNPEA